MATKLAVSEFDRKMREVLNRVAFQGESFILERNGRAIARLEPVGPRPGVTAQEVAEKLRHLEFPEGFADDLEAAMAGIPPPEVPSDDCGAFPLLRRQRPHSW